MYKCDTMWKLNKFNQMKVNIPKQRKNVNEFTCHNNLAVSFENQNFIIHCLQSNENKKHLTAIDV